MFPTWNDSPVPTVTSKALHCLILLPLGLSFLNNRLGPWSSLSIALLLLERSFSSSLTWWLPPSMLQMAPQTFSPNTGPSPVHTPSVIVCLHPALLTHFLFFVFPGSLTKARVSLTQRRSLVSSVPWPSSGLFVFPGTFIFYFFLIDQRIMYFNRSWICPSYPCCLLHGVSLLPGSCLVQGLWPSALT